jgi:DUF4097 and DUF4098 domain-containing protein YvlB
VANRPNKNNERRTMSHFRELLADARGPIVMELEANALNFQVKMERRSNVIVELKTRGNDGSEEARLIDTARLESTRSGYKLVVDVPESVTIISGGGRITSVVSNSTVYGSVVQIGRSGGSIQIGNGNVQINGFGRGNGLILEHGIDVTVYVPENSSVLMERGGGVHVSGRADRIDVDTRGGDVDFQEARALDITTSGGNITGVFVADDAKVRTSGGDIEIGETRGEIDLRTSGGNVRVGEAHGDGSMETSGGNVVLKKFYGRSMKMRTSGGNIRHPEHPGIKARTSGGNINGKSADRW